MWQRIQTIFLALVVISMVLSIFFPIWMYQDPTSGVRHELYPLHYSIVDGDQRSTAYFPYCITAVFMAAAATLAFMTLRRYDNRITQIKMGAFNTIILMGVMISAVVFSNRLTNEFKFGGSSDVALWIIFAAVAFNWISLRFIRRDEKKVRDSERLR